VAQQTDSVRDRLLLLFHKPLLSPCCTDRAVSALRTNGASNSAMQTQHGTSNSLVGVTISASNNTNFVGLYTATNTQEVQSSGS